MEKDDDLINMQTENLGILRINVFPIVGYPHTVRVSKVKWDQSYSPGKWRKRIGNYIYYFGKGLLQNYEEVHVKDPLFGKIFRKYILDSLSESVTEPWKTRELKSNLVIAKDISENYAHSGKIKLEYELMINIHHWQDTNFGLIADLRVRTIDRESGKPISYSGIKDKYGEMVRKNIWYSVQAFHKHLTRDGKKYQTAMRDKFFLLTELLKEAFGSPRKEKILYVPDGEVRLVFEPLEVVEVADDAI